MTTYEMDFRNYLIKHRNTRDLNKILISAATGLKELHKMGYVHRDFKPDNIVLNLKPLSVKLIDFNRATLITQETRGTVRGTPGYFPMRDELRDGSIYWDIWSLGAVILECDMEIDEYKQVMTERAGLLKAEKHLEKVGVCNNIKAIIRGTIMKARINEMMKLDEIIELLPKVSFRKIK
jgi:serine/threonine protein kinase